MSVVCVGMLTYSLCFCVWLCERERMDVFALPKGIMVFVVRNVDTHLYNNWQSGGGEDVLSTLRVAVVVVVVVADDAVSPGCAPVLRIGDGGNCVKCVAERVCACLRALCVRECEFRMWSWLR